eukprot:3048153-Pyramimonas_sp.AAC.1
MATTGVDMATTGVDMATRGVDMATTNVCVEPTPGNGATVTVYINILLCNIWGVECILAVIGTGGP